MFIGVYNKKDENSISRIRMIVDWFYKLNQIIKYEFFYKIKYLYQKINRGFSDNEWQNLDQSLANWLLPRIKYYRKNIITYPSEYNNLENWYRDLDIIIYSLETIKKLNKFEISWNDYFHSRETVKYGLELLSKNLINLWT